MVENVVNFPPGTIARPPFTLHFDGREVRGEFYLRDEHGRDALCSAMAGMKDSLPGHHTGDDAGWSVGIVQGVICGSFRCSDASQVEAVADSLSSLFMRFDEAPPPQVVAAPSEVHDLGERAKVVRLRELTTSLKHAESELSIADRAGNARAAMIWRNTVEKLLASMSELAGGEPALSPTEWMAAQQSRSDVHLTWAELRGRLAAADDLLPETRSAYCVTFAELAGKGGNAVEAGEWEREAAFYSNAAV